MDHMRAALRDTADSMRKKAADLRMQHAPPHEWAKMLWFAESIEATLAGGDDDIKELYNACRDQLAQRREAEKGIKWPSQ